jgi:hypothetical protein
VQAKKAWVERYITDSSDHFSSRVLASAVYTFMFNNAMIDTLLHAMKEESSGIEERHLHGLMRSLSKLQRDHQQYFNFYGILLGLLNNKPSQKLAENMVREVIQIESILLDNLFDLSGGSLKLGNSQVNPQLIKDRLKFRGDNCLKQLGFSKVFKVKDPLPWISAMMLKEALKDDAEHGVVQVTTQQAMTPKPKSSVEAQVFSLNEDF